MGYVFRFDRDAGEQVRLARLPRPASPFPKPTKRPAVNGPLGSSYDRIVFTEKCNSIFDLMIKRHPGIEMGGDVRQSAR